MCLFSDCSFEMPRFGDRTVYRRKDYACASGRRYVDGANAGKCMAKRKCKVRWSKKRGRCKKTTKERGVMYSIAE